MTELITTAEEFAALPIGTVVRSPGGYVFEQWRSGWERVGIALDWWHDEMAKNYSPATVLYRPDAEPTVPPKLRVKVELPNETDTPDTTDTTPRGGEDDD